MMSAYSHDLRDTIQNAIEPSVMVTFDRLKRIWTIELELNFFARQFFSFKKIYQGDAPPSPFDVMQDMSNEIENERLLHKKRAGST